MSGGRTCRIVFFSDTRSDFILPLDFWLSGPKLNKNLCVLKQNFNKRGFVNNFTDILFDLDFLTMCWVKTQINKEDRVLTIFPVLHKGNVIKIVEKMENGFYRFSLAYPTYLLTFKGKKKLVWAMPMTEMIVLKGVQILLKFFFLPTLNTYRFCRSRHVTGFLTIYDTILKCSSVSWNLKIGIKQTLSWVDPGSIIHNIQEKVKDQLFMNMVFKYFKMECLISTSQIAPLKTRLMAREILWGMSMICFDQWVEKFLILNYHTEIKFDILECFKYTVLLKNNFIRFLIRNDFDYKKLCYFREMGFFFIGVDGIKADCIELVNLFKKKLNNKLKLGKVRITHVEYSFHTAF
jgi:hypothetical protein